MGALWARQAWRGVTWSMDDHELDFQLQVIDFNQIVHQNSKSSSHRAFFQVTPPIDPNLISVFAFISEPEFHIQLESLHKSRCMRAFNHMSALCAHFHVRSYAIFPFHF